MTTTSTIRIEGMTCEGCVRSVTKLVAALPGVRAVKVSLTDGKAEVTYDSGAVTPARIREAVEDAGYEAPA